MQSLGQIDADYPTDVFHKLETGEVFNALQSEGTGCTSELSGRDCHRASSNEVSGGHVERSDNSHRQGCLLGCEHHSACDGELRRRAGDAEISLCGAL